MSDPNSFFKTKQTFLSRVLMEIGEKRDFDQYVSYLRNEENYLKRKIKEFITSVMSTTEDNKTRLECIIENEVDRNLQEIVQSTEETFNKKIFR